MLLRGRLIFLLPSSISSAHFSSAEVAVRVPSAEVQGKEQSDSSMKPPGWVNLAFCEFLRKGLGALDGKDTLESLLEEFWPV